MAIGSAVAGSTHACWIRLHGEPCLADVCNPHPQHAPRSPTNALWYIFTIVVCLQGEDWEYEDDRADDDLEMGKDEDADMPAPRRHGHAPCAPCLSPGRPQTLPAGDLRWEFGPAALSADCQMPIKQACCPVARTFCSMIAELSRHRAPMNRRIPPCQQSSQVMNLHVACQ